MGQGLCLRTPGPNTSRAGVTFVCRNALAARDLAGGLWAHGKRWWVAERETVKSGTLSLVPYTMTPEQFVDYARQAEEAYGASHYPAANPSVIVCSPNLVIVPFP